MPKGILKTRPGASWKDCWGILEGRLVGWREDMPQEYSRMEHPAAVLLNCYAALF